MDEKEYSNLFAIPANYTDSGKIFGGMLEPRNAIEAVLLVLVVGYPELMLIPMPGTIRIVVMTVTLIPLAIVAARFPVPVCRAYHPLYGGSEKITFTKGGI